MIKESIARLVEGTSLDAAEAAQVMSEIMTGEATPSQIGAFITALRMKGETVAEITGMARTMRAHAVAVKTPGPVVDTCGTGGDGAGTFNISTAAAVVAAAAGVTVAKHGNRAMSSRCGSADVLEAAGVNIELDGEGVSQCLAQTGIAFMFAPAFHPATKYAGPTRREIGIRTVFNILGPLTNPAKPFAQVLGVADPSLLEKMASTLGELGLKRALVVHGEDGLDEITTCGRTRVAELKNNILSTHTIDPAELGLKLSSRESLKGGSAEDNVKLLAELLDGVTGPKRDAVLLNTAAVLLVAGRVNDLKEGLSAAGETIDSGRAKAKLAEFAAVSQELGK
jgi:anthranilate phosphoribosyltransferase